MENKFTFKLEYVFRKLNMKHNNYQKITVCKMQDII